MTTESIDRSSQTLDNHPHAAFEGATNHAGLMESGTTTVTTETDYYDFEPDEDHVKGIPIWLHFDTIERMPPDDQIRCWLEMLFITAARIVETDEFGNPDPDYKYCAIRDNFLWWNRRKNQTGKRHAYIPSSLVSRLVALRNKYACKADRMFSATGDSLSRQFDKFWRPHLHPLWRKKIKLPPKENDKKGKYFQDPYLYHIKSYRKTGITIMLCRRYIKLCKQYNVPVESWNYALWKIAFGSLRKETGHRSEKMVLDHYLVDIHEIGALEYALNNPIKEYTSVSQPVLHYFFEKTI